MSERYLFGESEPKWQHRWEEQKLFTAQENDTRPSYYVLEMFPYPSGNIHMGHVRNYTLGDVVARYRRALGYNVLHPMGWDAFGLPAENAAIKNRVPPAKWTHANIATMREQLKSIGLSYDWAREVATCDAEYYQHEQRFFLKMLERGLAYRKQAVVNWDPVDNTVLANEQVIDGRGWRSGALVERRTLSQWFLKITDYAEDLLAGLETLGEWPDKVRLMQEKWIGRSYGASCELRVVGSEDVVEIYTTRPDTIFGMAFVAIAPDHPLSKQLAADNPQLAAFLQECSQLGTSEEAIEKAEKKGFDTGLRIQHPFMDKTVPIYIANFVLMDYGTGAVFGCPAHDVRDFEFATKYGLEIIEVVASCESPVASELPYTGNGKLINSDFLNGMDIETAKDAVISRLEARSMGMRKTNYRLRDWGISRQRYWGCPIPVIHCESCGAVPVPEKDLPVKLPEDVTFDKPGNPLDHHPSWKYVNCPKCGKAARRETDTFDTFFESSWYFARFASPDAAQGIDKLKADHWLPVDCYIGGIEHAVLHLLYSRFFTRVLKDCGYLSVEEPFKRLVTQGMICLETYKDGETGDWLSPDPEELAKFHHVKKLIDAEGLSLSEAITRLINNKFIIKGRSEKMSKSKLNTVDPRHIITSYGADTARLFMLSDSPPERDLEWTDAGIDGAWRYINRLWRLLYENLAVVKQADLSVIPTITDEALLSLRKKTHQTIDGVGKDIEAFHFNKAVARLRELSNLMASVDASASTESGWVFAEAMVTLIHLMAPFLPHLAEEMWAELEVKEMVAARAWPKADAALLVENTVTVAVQINGKLRTTLELVKDCDSQTAEKTALAHEKIREAVEGKQIKKIVVVPNRIVNVVAV